MNRVGIDTMSFYIPEKRISVETIIEHRKKESDKLGNILISARNTTNQEYMRLTHSWQDSVCIAAQSVISLLQGNDIDMSKLRYIIAGTETPVDASKPNSAFFLGILKQLNIPVPQNLVNYQVQHACAGGTIGLIQAVALILQNKIDSTALVSMADISHYEIPSSAEITQGAGSVTMLVNKNPRLLEMDIGYVGNSSSDVDDFFRPLNSNTAKVRGRYSMQCYIDATYESLRDYANQLGKDIETVINENDYLVFHTPFPSMPEMVVTSILKRKLSMEASSILKIIEDKCISYAAECVKDIGNTYTAATYFPLGYILQKEYQRISQDIIGKKILIFSYGAGNTALVFQATIAEGAPKIIESWNLSHQLERYSDITFDTYVKWCHITEPTSEPNPHMSRQMEHHVFLNNIREQDSYREYGIL